MKKIFALLQSPEQHAPADDTHDDIEFYFRRRRGRVQDKSMKRRILEIVVILSLLISAAAFIKHEFDTLFPPSNASHKQGKR